MDDIRPAPITVAVTHVTGFAPLDAQFGVLAKAAVPAPLFDPVFRGTPHVFAVLDAALIAQLPARLAGMDVPHACLFGDAADRTAEAAPWLVQLVPDDRLLRSLFTDDAPDHPATWAFWRARAGILIRSDMRLDALRLHLRRFLRVKDMRGKDFFFRFWEPVMAPLYFGNLDSRPDLIARWFRPRDGGRIDAILAPDPDGPGLWVIAPQGLTDAPHIPQGAFTLSDTDIAVMTQAQTRRQLDTLGTLLATTFPERLQNMPRGDLQHLTDTTVSRMMGYGFSQTDTLFRLLACEVFHGPGFESLDPTGALHRICRADQDEAEKMMHLTARMAELGRA